MLVVLRGQAAEDLDRIIRVDDHRRGGGTDRTAIR
jgi:hypothetical protein